MNAKQTAAYKAVTHVREGMTVGLGTGSTAYWAIMRLGEMVSEGLQIRAIATSVESDKLARSVNIPMVSFGKISYIDITIDGADEVDKSLQLIKGGGGALLREKIVASASRFYIIIVDEHKLVDTLGKFFLPVEVLPFGWEMTFNRLNALGCEAKMRMKSDQLYVTDNGNYIADCNFKSITNPSLLHRQINDITGVIDNGLFVNMANMVIVGTEHGTVQVLESSSSAGLQV